MSEDKGYIVRRLQDVSPVPCPCGQSIRAITGNDNNLASIHVVTISKDSKIHYHKKLTEFYYVLEGEGELERILLLKGRKLSRGDGRFQYGGEV